MKTIRTLGFFASLAFSLVFPLLFPNPAITTVAVFTLIVMAAATGWNIFSGYTRYLSLGHAAFYGLGAYILASLCQIWHIQGGFVPLLLLPLVGLVTGLCSLPLGWIALLTRRVTFMVITIAIFSLLAQLPNLLNGIFPGLSEISLPLPPWNPDMFNLPFYYTALFVLLCALAVSKWIRSSTFGLILLSIGDDEGRARGLGIKVHSYTLGAWIISAIFVGMTGALNAYFIGLLTPEAAFDRTINVALPLTAFIGGIGTLAGPLLGAILIVPIQQYLTLQYGEQGLNLVLYGTLLLVVILILPQGVIPTIQKQFSRRMIFHKNANSSRNQARDFTDLSGSPAFAVRPAISHEATNNDGSYAQTLESLETSIPHRRSVSLPLGSASRPLKASRLVPYSQETVVDTSTGPSRQRNYEEDRPS